MLTPRFELSQTETEILITIHAPYANIKDTECYAEGTDFRFYSTPYYLRLQLPGEIIENDASSGRYDCEKGDFYLQFLKVNQGEHFENLDMITTLLAPPKKRSNAVPTIEVISNPIINSGEDINDNATEENAQESDADSKEEWFVPQELPPENVSLPGNAPKYGFASKLSNALINFEAAWTGEIIDLPNPDVTLASERKCLREKHEYESFSEEHYMADLIERECIEPCLTYTPEWETLKDSEITLTDTEKDLLKELPNKEYLLDNNELRLVCFGLVDILYGCCYNSRTTLGENTVESIWTINKLSSTLCWLQEFSSMEEVIMACVRRSLCYPLFRNWDLSMKVLEDLKTVVKLGRKYIIKRFCEIHEMFNNSFEPRYILNQLYIKDYLIWLQQAPASTMDSLYTKLEGIKPKKVEMGLDLDELETAAYSVQEEDIVIGNAIHEMVDEIDALSVNDSKKEKLESDSSSDSDSDSGSSSSSSSSSSDSSLDSDDTDELE